MREAREEKEVHASTRQVSSSLIEEWRALARGPKRSLFSSTVHGAFSFLWQDREKRMGGAFPARAKPVRRPRPVGGQLPSPRRGIPPSPARGRTALVHGPRPCALTPPHRGQKYPHNHSLPQTPAARPASPGGFPPSGGTPPCSWPWTFEMSPAPPHGCGPRSCPDW